MKRSRQPQLETLEDRTVPVTWGNPWPDALHLTLSFAPDGTNIGADIQAWVAQLVLPIAFALIAVRLVWRPGFNSLNPVTHVDTHDPEATDAALDAAGARLKPSRYEGNHAANASRERPLSAASRERPRSAKAVAERSIWLDRALASIGILAGILLVRAPSLVEGHSLWPIGIMIVAAAVAGMPLFAILGGTAALLFMHDGVTPATVLIETYSLSVSPTLPAIPLFTLAGFLLAEGRASERLLRVFRALFGWIPGGTAVVCAVLCSFFTVFTGGSGVTILALGGVLFPALLKDGYRERFALGLLTASGSLGLLLPPALPLILYAVVMRTKLGKAMRAVAEDRDAAALMGINVDGIILFTFALGGAMAGAAGVLYALVFKQVHFFMGFVPGIKAFTSAVLGGIGNIPGAMLGGLFLGIVESVGPALFLDGLGIRAPYQLRDVIGFTMLLIMLIFRPQGILGERLAAKRA